MNVMVLAAGLGTRLRPYTDTAPKPAIPFMTVPLACYPLSLFEGQKIHKLVVNTHHLPEKIEHLFDHIYFPKTSLPEQIIFSPESEKILGSGGGLRQAMPNLVGQGTIAVVNADEVILPAHFSVIQEALEFHHFHGGLATMLCIQHPEVGHKFGGIWLENERPANSQRAQQGRPVKCFSKTPVQGHRGLHFVGIFLVREEIQKYFFSEVQREENILYETLTRAIAAGEQVHAFEIDAQWFEVGNPQDFIAATELCLKAIVEKPEAPWVQYLRQLICRFDRIDPIIESPNLELKKKLMKLVDDLLEGRI